MVEDIVTNIKRIVVVTLLVERMIIRLVIEDMNGNLELYLDVWNWDTVKTLSDRCKTEPVSMKVD